MKGKVLGTIQIHLDPIWAITKTFGVDSPIKNYVYHKVVPSLLKLLHDFNLRATFFVIGKDIMIEENQSIVREIGSRGHEIGNHSLTHPIGFRFLSRPEKEKEIGETEKLIEDITGFKPRGFAAPAFDIDEITLQILQERGYLYDTSVFPSYFSFVAKAYRHLETIILTRSFYSTGRPSSWGKLTYMFAPRRPYHPSLKNLLRRGNSKIVEIPMSTIPFWNLPFYDYFCLLAGNWYFRTGLRLLASTGKEINYLIHPTELLNVVEMGKNGVNLCSMPTVCRPYEKKLRFLKHVLREIKSHYQIVPLKEFAQRYV